MPTLDPNLVYLIIICGLWLGVTAVYVPGTGILEMLALAALVGSVVVLAAMPTNWGAVLLIIVGVMGFILVPFLKRELALLAVAGLGLQALGGWLLFDGLSVSPFLIGLTVLLPLVYHQFVLLPMLDKTRAQPIYNEDDLLIGAHGRVVRALNPTGTIQVRGELWTATSDRPLEPGTEVIVIEREGLQVHVEGIKQKRSEYNDEYNGSE